eukprot:gene9138-10785_t
MDLPFGPTEGGTLATDDFTLKDVQGDHCTGRECRNICADLVGQYDGRSRFLTICVPCYNEDLDELLKTIYSVMENVEFMKRKARFYGDKAGFALQQEFINTVPIIVPIFDGVAKVKPSVQEWLSYNYPKALDVFEDVSSGSKDVEVRAVCRKWWFYSHDTLPNSALSLSKHDDNMITFHMAVITKRNNHRKHNSHQWFFDGICQGLGERNAFAFLTDCGTTYDSACVARLFYELRLRTDLIGVTARQRVAFPDAFFHPCEKNSLSCLRGDHTATTGSSNPCWKCYLAFFTSPAPLQGFEFEATLIMNSAMFNMAEALPVMPGPCQLLNWQKMKEFRVVEEYFNLLFNSESDKCLPCLPSSFQRMSDLSVESELYAAPNQNAQSTINFTEFLRTNMRLAEDRILSFVCVFSTGYGTKWIPGATFYYQPELCWQSLLTQRRRWLNGTFASFLFFFRSKRAIERVKGGLFDSHKLGKNIRFIRGLWSLQLAQLLLVLLAPAVFGSASYIGLQEMAANWEDGFGWATRQMFGPVSIAELWLFLYLAAYVLWTFRSFYVEKGLMPEMVCWVYAIAGFFVMFPVYLAVWWTVAAVGLDVINVLVIGSLALPVVVALAQSVQSAILYFCYLPWFMTYIVFFLVCIPSYSFARLWDTTWGTAKDSAISDTMEQHLKSRNLLFICLLTSVNALAAWAFIWVFKMGYSAVMSFMILVFSPMMIQLVFSFLFLFVVVPARYLTQRSAGFEHNIVGGPSGSMVALELNNLDHGKGAAGNARENHFNFTDNRTTTSNGTYNPLRRTYSKTDVENGLVGDASE